MIFLSFSGKLKIFLIWEGPMAEKSKQKKENKKAPQKSMKEKKKEKLEKKANK
jgi:hypothetical protein